MCSQDSLIEIARVVKPLGIRGELKVLSLSRTPQELERYRYFYIQEDGVSRRIEVRRFSCRSGNAVIALEGIENRDQAERYRGKPLYISENQLSAPAEGEYYLSDLIGLKVQTPDGEFLGTLTDVFELPAHDVYQVKDGEKELLIPAVSEFILNVDLRRSIMTVMLIDGLSEIT